MPILWANQQSELSFGKLNLISFRSSCMSTGVVSIARVHTNIVKIILLSRCVGFPVHIYIYIYTFSKVLSFNFCYQAHLPQVQIKVSVVCKAVFSWSFSQFLSHTEDKCIYRLYKTICVSGHIYFRNGIIMCLLIVTCHVHQIKTRQRKVFFQILE